MSSNYQRQTLGIENLLTKMGYDSFSELLNAMKKRKGFEDESEYTYYGYGEGQAYRIPFTKQQIIDLAEEEEVV